MSISPLISEALRTRRKYGIGLWRQLRQILRLRYGASQLDPWEYYFFRVFLDRYTPEEKGRFIGWRREILLDRQANARDARIPANDKLAFHQLLEKHGMPLAKILAVYGGNGMELTGAKRLTRADEVTAFLRAAQNNNTDLPMFVKPVRGTQGKNVHVLHGLENDNLLLAAGNRVKLSTFVEQLDAAGKGGMLFQELLLPATELENICGRRLTSVRIIIIVTAAGPEILSAVWRVPTGANITDNFSCGMNGNIIAGIDLSTGKIQHIVRGIGWENFSVNRHPDTGIVFGDLQLPGWRQVCRLCLDAAALFPGLHMQHWDVALTNRGPVMLEVNVEGGMRTHQIVQERGLYGARLRRACEG